MFVFCLSHCHTLQASSGKSSTTIIIWFSNIYWYLKYKREFSEFHISKVKMIDFSSIITCKMVELHFQTHNVSVKYNTRFHIKYFKPIIWTHMLNQFDSCGTSYEHICLINLIHVAHHMNTYANQFDSCVTSYEHICLINLIRVAHHMNTYA